MTIMQKQNENDNAIFKCCQRFIKRFHINRLLREVNACKEKGISANEIFALLLSLIFTQKNLFTLINTCHEQVAFEKDVVYRFLGKASINWNRFINRLSCMLIPEIDRLTSNERRTALIIDDSPYYRNRSKKVELLSRCFDHVTHKYYKGFTLLALGWSDGQTFIPVDYRLVASGKDENLLQGTMMRTDKRTLASKRRIDARKDKPALVLDMLKSARGTAAQARYVLFDSWFASPSSILNIHALGYQVVSRLKNNKNFLYTYDGQNRSISAIYNMNKKRRGKSRYLLSVSVDINHTDFPDPIPAKLVYIRDKANRKKWITLISTDLSLSEEDIIALYGKRWDIESFFKVIKTFLHLTGEFQTRSFDAMSAHIAIVFTRYSLLALENRENKDDRTIGELFYVICDELKDISFAYAFKLLVQSLEQYLLDYIHLSKKNVYLIVQEFISSLPAFLRAKLTLSVCES